MNLPARIPATIVTGFLGSGKTTLLRHLLDNADGRRIAVIVNEFGELGIDGEILRGCGIGCDEPVDSATASPAGTVYELANGCLCCTVQEEFYPVMRELIARREQIDHILIETSGLALPKPLVQAFNWPEIKTACTVDAVVTVVDVPAAAEGLFAADPAAVDRQRRADPNLDHESPLHELFEDQLSAADLVVLSKTDLAPPAAREAVEALVRGEVPAEVKVVTAEHGRLDPALLLGLGRAAEEHIHLRPSHHDHHHEDEDEHGHGDAHHDHDHDAFDAVVLDLPLADRDALLAGLQALVREHTVYRVKGFVAVPGKPMRLVVHGVGKRFDSYFDRPWRADETPATQLVIIGETLDAARLREHLLAAVTEPA
ncbi:MAG: cobalamin biosynthesis protein CobW [Rhodocyclaceae bacterium]